MVDLETTAALPILIASFLGSPHCVGMCGGFVALYSHHAGNHALAHMLYSLGRLCTYITLGVAAALLGASIDGLVGIGRISALVVAISLIVLGLTRVIGMSFDPFRKILSRYMPLLQGVIRPVLSSHSVFKPLLVGMVTTLLPCGWLYAFVALAMGTANVWIAAQIMFLFWVGTLPALVLLGCTSRALTQGGSRWFPRLVGALLIMSGFLALAMHLPHKHDHTTHAQHNLAPDSGVARGLSEH